MTTPTLPAADVAQLVDVTASAVDALDVLGDTVLRVRACSGWWFFNLDRARFCVAEPGTDPFFLAPAHWRDYAELRFAPDDASFHVVVDHGGGRGLWGHRHEAGCPRC